jgi:hypothetical protein
MDKKSRIKAEEKFLDPHCRILLATDAASEGLNLQKKCHILINYELPWNPNRLEQRIGRVHRYGQKRDVKIFNLLNLATREGAILQKLQNKIEEIRKALGCVGEVLGCVAAANVEEAIRKSLRDNIDPEITAEEIASAIEQGRRVCQEFQNLGLTKLQQFDNTALKKILGLVGKNKELEDDWKNGRFFQQFMQTFFNTSISPTRRSGEFKFRVPLNLHQYVNKRYFDSIVFDKDHSLLEDGQHTEFFGFGHHLVKGAINQTLKENHQGLGQSSFKILKEANEIGVLINFHAKIESEGIRFDMESEASQSTMEILAEEIIPVFIAENSASIADGVTYNRLEGVKKEFPQEIVIGYSEKIDEWMPRAEQIFIEEVEKKKAVLKEERNQKIQARLTDLERYWKGMQDRYKKKINLLESELDLYEEFGEEFTKSTRTQLTRTKNEMDRVKKRVDQQREMLSAMKKIFAHAPEILNVAWIIPSYLG